MSLRVNVQRETFPGEAYLYDRDIGCCGHREYCCPDVKSHDSCDVASESLPVCMQETGISGTLVQ